MSASLPLGMPKLRVLVVDDFDGHASSTALLLSAFGYEAQYALDVHAALDKAKDFAPDVVLLDLALPRMSGYEVADRLANGWTVRPPVIVAVTGWSRDEDRRKSLAAGFHLHLAKPVEPHILFGILERIRNGVGTR